MQYKITLTDTGKKKVYVNPGVREGIYLYPGEIKKLRLEDGSELEQDEFERIRLEYALPRAKHRAIAILAKRDKTEQELRDKLLQSLTDTQSLEEAISYMKSCAMWMIPSTPEIIFTLRRGVRVSCRLRWNCRKRAFLQRY